MKTMFLKSKNLVLKGALTILGFSLAASQALAQYMAIIPKKTFFGSITGVSDTNRNFTLVLNEQDTLYTSWKKEYKFVYRTDIETDSIRLNISENVAAEQAKYKPHEQVFAIKEDRIEVEIELEKKDD